MTLEMTVPSGPRAISDLVVIAGPDEEDPSKSVLILLGKDPSNKDALLFVTLPQNLVTPGTIDVGKGLVESFLLFTPEGGTEPDELYFLSGTLTTTAGAPTTGTSWSGTLELTGWGSPIFSGPGAQRKAMHNGKRTDSLMRLINANVAASDRRSRRGLRRVGQ